MSLNWKCLLNCVLIFAFVALFIIILIFKFIFMPKVKENLFVIGIKYVRMYYLFNVIEYAFHCAGERGSKRSTERA